MCIRCVSSWLPGCGLLIFLIHGVATAANTFAPWLTQAGLNSSIMTESSGVSSLTLGLVDTGITPGDAAFSPGQVLTTLSSCAAISFRCSNAYIDDEGHGTAVGSIAASSLLSTISTHTGSYAVSVGNQLGMAPGARIVAEKVLNSAGTGAFADVANGITRAVAAGASVINLSLTFYVGEADLVTAINKAAAAGVYIVWAGGNSSEALLNGDSTSGLTAVAISHLILVGSVSSQNTLSSFSNTPGSGVLISSTSTTTRYANRWLMAPGENILAPEMSYGRNAWGYWSGTSMSTPLVSGALLLLESTWPVLKTNGTAANLLLSTTTNLGASSVYGSGLLNLTAAFQPSGTLSVTQSNGAVVSISSLNALGTSGVLGNLPALQARLANYTVFDRYQRAFSANLSSLIQSRSTAATLNLLPANPATLPKVIRLQDGETLTLEDHSFGGVRQGYAMLTALDGTTLALGYGASMQYPYASALYGDDNLASLNEALGSTQLSRMGEGGGLFSYGMQLGSHTRVAVAWSGTTSQMAQPGVASDPFSSASNLSVGLTHQFSSRLTAGVTADMLNEQNGLLGTTYSPGSTLGLGGANKSYGMSLFAGVHLSPHDSLLMEAGMSRTEAASGSGLIAGTRALTSQALGLGLLHSDLFRPDDRLTLSATQPLRVTSGQIGVVMPGVDATTGVPSYQTAWVSAAPSGRERDYEISYSAPWMKTQAFGVSFGYDQDAGQIKGNNLLQGGVTWTAHF